MASMVEAERAYAETCSSRRLLRAVIAAEDECRELRPWPEREWRRSREQERRPRRLSEEERLEERLLREDDRERRGIMQKPVEGRHKAAEKTGE